MKRTLKLLACGLTMISVAIFTGCSSDDEPFADFDGNVENPVSRAAKSQVVIDFENMMGFTPEYDEADPMANPTSYGLNYYESSSSYPQVSSLMDYSNYFMSQINEGSWNGSPVAPSFMYGGIALSDWAMTSNPSTNPNPDKPFKSDWWMSEYNQMSVYNTARTTTGNRGGAGANGSNNFGVVYGYDDTYANTTKEAYFTIPNEAMTLKSMKICNTAYTYGVIQNGNVWEGDGVTVLAQSLVKTKGYLTLIIKCYDESDNLVKRIETPLADYQNGKNFCVTTWTEIPINASGVSKVQFGFWGSDVTAGGLCTPAYVAIDDIVLE